MEIELKYSIEDDSLIERISEDKIFTSIEEKDSRETSTMKAVYFDTDDEDLRKLNAAFRVRLEGNRYVATLKRKAEVEGELHKREEINAPVIYDEFVENPNISIFGKEELIEDILPIIKGKKLAPIMEMNYVRESFKVDYKGSLMEVSIDQGDILTGKGSCPICEIEIELYCGKEEDLLKLGKNIQKAYNLKAESISKYGKGLDLL